MATRDYRLLAYFTVVADTGSIRAAARRLGVSAPVVSTALADLEANHQVTLFRRGGRRLTLTPEGTALHAATAEMVAAADRAMALIDRSAAKPHGPLGVTAPTELTLPWLLPRVARFEADHPSVRITLHALDTPINLVQSDVDLALRAFHTLDPAAHPERVDLLPLILVAAPHLIDPRPQTQAERLSNLPFIGFTPRPDPSRLTALDPGGARRDFTLHPRFIVNNGVIAGELARAGMGAALLIEAAVADDLAAGRLVRVPGDAGFGWVAVTVLMRDRLPSAAARAFLATLKSPS